MKIIKNFYKDNGKRISAAGKKWLKTNRHKFELWLLDGRDDLIEIAVVKKGLELDGRGDAWANATFVYTIYEEDSLLSPLDKDFIEVLGNWADVS